MIPPLVRRCPACGTLGFRFAVITEDGERRLECPACHHRFDAVDRPWLR